MEASKDLKLAYTSNICGHQDTYSTMHVISLKVQSERQQVPVFTYQFLA